MRILSLLLALTVSLGVSAHTNLNLPKGHLYILDVRGLDIPQGEKRGAGPNKLSAEMFSQIALDRDEDGHARLINLGKVLLSSSESASYNRGFEVVYLSSQHGSLASRFMLRLYFTDTFGNLGRSPNGEALYREVTAPKDLNRFLSNGESLVYVHRGMYQEPRMSNLTRQIPTPIRYREGDDINALAMVGVLMSDGQLVPLDDYLSNL